MNGVLLCIDAEFSRSQQGPVSGNDWGMEALRNDIGLREQLSALVQTAVDAMVSVDTEGTVHLSNPAVERIFGWPAEDLVGQNVSVLMGGEHQAQHDQYMSRYLDGGEARIIGKGRAVRGRRRDGTEFPVHLSVGEFSVSGRRYFVGILRDLTVETREHARLRQLEDQLSLVGRRAAVSEMGASLAHELNQPLTAIDLFLTAAKRAFPDDPERAFALCQDARAEAQRAASIIKRVRKMVEGGRNNRAFFPLEPVVQDAIELCRMTDTENPARFEIHGAEGVKVFGDEVEIRQVLVNLIKNALEATEGQSDRHIRIDIHRQRAITVDVSDNGPGLDQDLAARVFDPFQSTKPHGLGMGLSICRSIVENHGGELLHVSGPRGLPGACFRVRLPDVEDEPSRRSPGDTDSDR